MASIAVGILENVVPKSRVMCFDQSSSARCDFRKHFEKASRVPLHIRLKIVTSIAYLGVTAFDYVPTNFGYPF